MTLSQLTGFAVLLILSGCSNPGVDENQSTASAPPSLYIPHQVFKTQNFAIHSSATKEQTASVGSSVEALYRSYVTLFEPEIQKNQFHLVLFKDQAEFKKHNRSSPWAEAYYKRPYSFAYAATGENPYHWMLHEVTHQLLAEASGYKLRRWLNEGMATYLGSSKISGNVLQVGNPDKAAYPIWWLAEIRFDQSSTPTFSGSPIPSLQEIIEESGPPVSENVNSYYIAWWSLVHFLMQGDGGAHRQDAIELLKEGGSPDEFQRLIGNYTDIEPRWHLHLQSLTNSGKSSFGGL
jgi:hypothetical protein